eukprot:2328380-Lingulodinium_polyedra.AAC.1
MCNQPTPAGAVLLANSGGEDERDHHAGVEEAQLQRRPRTPVQRAAEPTPAAAKSQAHRDCG